MNTIINALAVFESAHTEMTDDEITDEIIRIKNLCLQLLNGGSE